ncbi:hypothetical protein K502DRAFT_361410 [Neoconidiobolus thromboides FSU 785]|nr:hypothetical protein K502DRAFT_361410 [Neoconidiobolus thromboides FSU 785]
MLTLLTLINLFYYKVIALLPRASEGGCIVIEDKLYYLGGRTYSPNIGYIRQNYEVFTLNLQEGFKLAGNIAPWERKNITNPPRTMLTKYMFYIGTENRRKTIVGFKNDYMRLGLVINYFDMELNKWYKEDFVDKMYAEFNIANVEIINSQQIYFLLQDEKDLNQFYISGSFHYRNSTERTSLQLNSFNIKTKQMKLIHKTNKKVIFEQLFILNNKLYYVEYTTEYKRELIYRNKTLYELDLKTYNLKTYSLNINLLYYQSTFVKVQQSIYLIGLRDGNKRIMEIYEFKFNPFLFKRIDKKIASFNHWGCFASYDSFIINSFGDQYGGTNTVLESTDKMLILDTKSWEVVGGLPSLIENKENIRKDDSENDNTNKGVGKSDKRENNSSLIGGVVGGIGGFLIIAAAIIFIFYKRKLKKDKPPSIIMEPILTKPIDLLDANNIYYNSGIFNYSQEIDFNSNILPAKTHLKLNGNNYS